MTPAEKSALLSRCVELSTAIDEIETERPVAPNNLLLGEPHERP